MKGKIRGIRSNKLSESKEKEEIGVFRRRSPFRKKLILADRKLSWLLFILTFLGVVTGYMLTRTESQPVPTVVHVILSVVFVLLLMYHVYVYTFLVKYNWKKGFNSLLVRKISGISFVILVLRVSGIIILISGLFVFISGLDYYFVLNEPFSLSNHVIADNIFYIAFSVHMAAGLKLLLHRKKKSRFVQNLSSVLFLMVLFLPAFAFESGFVYNITEEPGNSVQVDGVVYSVDPLFMSQARPDIFQEGKYSMFDALVMVSEKKGLDLKYHYDPEMETNVIDSLKGSSNWWYEGYYDGGYTSVPFGEINYQRMDEYPWKEGATLRMVRVSPDELEERYEVFRTEIMRKDENGGRIIIPRVIIEGRENIYNYGSVEVYAHNLRNDTFRDGVVTAIDAVMTLGDLGYLSYTLKWYDSIGTAEVVRSYFVESIDRDSSYNRCGFVYECGEPGYEFFKGNHIHIPSDWRVLKSPEYLKYFWICI
jgi:hypothetical protein